MNYRTQNPEPPTSQDLLRGLSREEVGVILDLVAVLRKRRTQNPRTASIDPLAAILADLVREFVGLYGKHDDQSLGEASRRTPNSAASRLNVQPSETSRLRKLKRLIRLASFLYEKGQPDRPSTS